MKTKPGASIVVALLLALGVSAWILSGLFADGETDTVGTTDGDAQTATQDGGEGENLPAVRVVDSMAREHVTYLRLTGRTESERRALIRAETRGAVIALETEETARVAKGDILARLAINDRQARLTAAEALLTQRRIEFEAADKLASKGFQSQVQKAQAEARLGLAEADMRTIRLDINKTVIRAPFDGHVNRVHVEIGDYLQVGDRIVGLSDLDPMMVRINVSEREIGEIEAGVRADITLISGERLQGEVVRTDFVADPVTRTFGVELQVANPDALIRDGVTATVRMPTRPVRAHFLYSDSFLTLDGAGRVGIKAVEEGRVVFHPVTILDDMAEGVWVSDLPDAVRIIAVGQEYVVPGMQVESIPVTAADMAS